MSAPSETAAAHADGLDDEQRAALAAPFDVALQLIGASGSGKTETLAHRVARAQRLGLPALALTHGEPARRRLRARLDELGARAQRIERFADLAADLGRAHAAQLDRRAVRAPLQRLDAKRLFERCVEPLFALTWPAIERGEIDPEVSGMAWPERFRDDAFELIWRLHEAGIGPDDLLAGAERGGDDFYAKTSIEHLAHLARSAGLTDRQRASLTVDQATLSGQRRRERDLARILVQLYDDFSAALAQSEAWTEPALVAALISLLREQPDLAAEQRALHPVCIVDDADACCPQELALLRALYGDELRGVTLAGGTRSPCVSENVVEIRLGGRHRFVRVPQTTLYRAGDAAGEARFVASEIERLRAEHGLPLGAIAVIARELRGTIAVQEALTRRDLPFQHVGSAHLYDDPCVLDVLALAGAACDPGDTIRLLRALQTPVVGLSDRSLYVLCSPPPGPQTPLFEELETLERGAVRRSRPRDALTRNVLDGSADARLSPEGAARVAAFRHALPGWGAAAERCAPDAFLALVADESGYARWIATLPVALRRHARRQIERLLKQASDFASVNPGAPFAAFLALAEDLSRRDAALAHDVPLEGDAVALLAADTRDGHEFEAIFVVGAHAGSFPRYFVPPSFYYSPRIGIVARENLEDGGGPETAKFAWYAVRQRLAARYYEQERSLFEAVRARARSLLYVTAFGRPTRALRNPELLEELRAARGAGIRDVTGVLRAP